ncbi:MAG TPA: ubiquitin-like domain-containing protein [Propionibacteriaceae bacterium]|nr:ubiquitin-like domain-containing protein [Propionibacteriaceae bacterium]
MRKIIPVVAAGATALALAGTTFGYASLNKSVTLSVDGQTTEVRTSAGTVAALLRSRGIEVNGHDVVAPNLDAKVQDGTRVAVKFGRQVTFTVDGAAQTIWTTATTVDDALAALGMSLTGAELSTSRSSGIGRQGLTIVIATQKKIIIIDAGKKRTITTTGQTLADALAAAKIKVDADDELSASPKTRLVDGAKFTFTDVEISSKTKKLKVDFDTVRKESSKLKKGVTKIDTPGERGVRAVTYKIVRHNDEIVKRAKIKSKLINKPVTEVILVGTKKTTTAKKSSGGSSTPSGSVWDKLAQCESGGNWSINTGNGYYGGLQFSLSTWRAYGGSGMPNKASREQQIAIAKKLQADAGWGAWPACSSKLGLR